MAEKLLLIHPDGKKGVSMDSEKYEVLRRAFLSCLRKRQQAAFPVLQLDVEAYLAKHKLAITGKLQWNLFWVTLDLEAKKQIGKNRSVSPIIYTITPP